MEPKAPHQQKLSVERGGRAYDGYYEVRGRKVSVSSPYGAMTVSLSDEAPERLAEDVLLAIVGSRRA